MCFVRLGKKNTSERGKPSPNLIELWKHLRSQPTFDNENRFAPDVMLGARERRSRLLYFFSKFKSHLLKPQSLKVCSSLPNT